MLRTSGFGLGRCAKNLSLPMLEVVISKNSCSHHTERYHGTHRTVHTVTWTIVSHCIGPSGVQNSLQIHYKNTTGSVQVPSSSEVGGEEGEGVKGGGGIKNLRLLTLCFTNLLAKNLSLAYPDPSNYLRTSGWTANP